MTGKERPDDGKLREGGKDLETSRLLFDETFQRQGKKNLYKP